MFVDMLLERPRRSFSLVTYNYCLSVIYIDSLRVIPIPLRIYLVQSFLIAFNSRRIVEEMVIPF